MKTYKRKVKTITDNELAESLVFPVSLTEKQRQADTLAIQKLREESAIKSSNETRLTLQLLQLKFKIEEYLKKSTHEEQLSFGYFLRAYVDLVSHKQKEFATAIDIKPAELSQIINSHRKPPYGFVIRLEIHSNKAISALHWNRILEKENEYALINDKQIWREQRKHVKSRLRIKI